MGRPSGGHYPPAVLLRLVVAEAERQYRHGEVPTLESVARGVGYATGDTLSRRLRANGQD